ncbi:uncharacterized protein LY79DRAFT_663761 [Colletotrichum navitas]|uniref:Uncharacterized protein n=1 Tax=Colletotrichum navitas TaxID=681940 RepID=A0AAD8UXK7_9PEZI|nr:uncharacterized protein LY79DRAFT_663761 [Colletotrichum navitas]KAK1566388.1 hypothetical protein LY79DRAFT_663761 [Colletotrichum navitas]
MDDKGAVAVTLLKRDAQDVTKPQYDRVIMVFTAAADRVKIAQGMEDYLERAARHSPALPSDWRSRTTWLQAESNVLGEAVPHEGWYRHLPKPTWNLPIATADRVAASVAKAGGEPSVDIFQIAPYEDRAVWELFNKIPNINIYHLFYGYNSRQGVANDRWTAAEKKALSKRQVEFHATLQRRLQTKHPRARLIFTQNPISFDDPRAGSQDLNWCRRYFPETDIMMALRDPFWTKLILKANTYADRARLRGVPHNEYDDAFMTRVVNARQQDNSERKHIATMLRSAATSNTFKTQWPRSHYRVTNIGIPEFSGKPSPTLELGDGNHIAAVLEYLDSEAGHSRAGSSAVGKLLPAMCDTTEGNPDLPPTFVKLKLTP